MGNAGAEVKWHPGSFAFNIFVVEDGKDAIIDKNSQEIIFEDYQENGLAK